ncbi:hypothetical protein [Breoghania sp.]|uniref:hypothetical protein n=1 Tax=Breoghania sp. TaxID=2065378 RepID=UPI00260803A7|nr:hypothetical protein [Breoghania sp.]MDJ0933085.1 hypothetical protein [Breoghania sp.]
MNVTSSTRWAGTPFGRPWGALTCGSTQRVLTVVGNDYPETVLDVLTDAGLDVSAVKRIDRSHPVRVTFAHIPDGSRIQPVPAYMIEHQPAAVRAAFVDTTSQPDVLPLGAPTADDIPAD